MSPPLIYFILGIILGILVRDIKCKGMEVTDKVVGKIVDKLKPSPEAQFLEPFTQEEKWKEAKNITDLLE